VRACVRVCVCGCLCGCESWDPHVSKSACVWVCECLHVIACVCVSVRCVRASACIGAHLPCGFKGLLFFVLRECVCVCVCDCMSLCPYVYIYMFASVCAFVPMSVFGICVRIIVNALCAWVHRGEKTLEIAHVAADSQGSGCRSAAVQAAAALAAALLPWDFLC
jgi:hypothetical protein